MGEELAKVENAKLADRVAGASCSFLTLAHFAWKSKNSKSRLHFEQSSGTLRFRVLHQLVSDAVH